MCGRPRHLARRDHALGRARPPAVATETLPAGGDRQHELRLSPAGRSALLTARTHSHRCRHPTHLPNHHRASPAAGCPAIPSVAPQRSPRGRRDRATGQGRALWAVGSSLWTVSPSSAAPRGGFSTRLSSRNEYYANQMRYRQPLRGCPSQRMLQYYTPV